MTWRSPFKSPPCHAAHPISRWIVERRIVSTGALQSRCLDCIRDQKVKRQSEEAYDSKKKERYRGCVIEHAREIKDRIQNLICLPGPRPVEPGLYMDRLGISPRHIHAIERDADTIKLIIKECRGIRIYHADADEAIRLMREREVRVQFANLDLMMTVSNHRVKETLDELFTILDNGGRFSLNWVNGHDRIKDRLVHIESWLSTRIIFTRIATGKYQMMQWATWQKES